MDYKSVSYAIEVLRKKHDKPFFLACGIFKPHSPFFAPLKYHGLYDEEIALPERKQDDWSDLPAGAARLMGSKKWFWNGMMKVEGEKKVEGEEKAAAEEPTSESAEPAPGIAEMERE